MAPNFFGRSCNSLGEGGSMESRSEISKTRELVAQAQGGDDTAFGELVRSFRGLVFAACFERTGNFADSEDLTQEVFLAARRSLSSLEQSDSLAAWLRGIARNLCFMHLRRFRRESVLADVPERVVEIAPTMELQNLLHGALMRITERSREVVSLHYLGGYSYSEIGALCDLPAQVVRSRLHEGRKQLKSRLLEVVAQLCECSRDAECTTRCVRDRCGVEACGCVVRLRAV
jgi:RNA polymerase sigma-70 factor (ECF subfamily)